MNCFNYKTEQIRKYNHKNEGRKVTGLSLMSLPLALNTFEIENLGASYLLSA